jgi:thiol-disulfide isomerase/thioredoxin
MPRPSSIRLPLALLGGAMALGLIVHEARGQVGPRDHGWLGISMAQSGKAPSPPGVLVDHVVRGSPADRVGIRAGDRVVRVATGAVAQGRDVVRAVAEHPVGGQVDVVFVHAGVERTARVTLAAFPSPDDLIRMDLVGTFAPPLTDLHAVSGAFPASMAAMRGRVVLLDFWATWCGPCRLVAPKLSALQSRYGAQGLSVIGVAADDEQDIAAFATQTAVSYPLAADKNGETSSAYGVSSLPTLLIIDKRGVVREVAVGYDPSEDAWLDRTVRGLLAEPGDPADPTRRASPERD